MKNINPQEEAPKVENTPILGVRSGVEYAAEYKAKLRVHYKALKEAQKFLDDVLGGKFKSNLQPEALSKVLDEQREIIDKAKEEILKIQKENETEITKHMQ